MGGLRVCRFQRLADADPELTATHLQELIVRRKKCRGRIWRRGRLAQLVRALARQARGHRFESRIAHLVSAPNRTFRYGREFRLFCWIPFGHGHAERFVWLDGFLPQAELSDMAVSFACSAGCHLGTAKRKDPETERGESQVTNWNDCAVVDGHRESDKVVEMFCAGTIYVSDVPAAGPNGSQMGRRCNMGPLKMRGIAVNCYGARNAGVAELADALDSKSSARKGVGVQVPPPVLFFLRTSVITHWILATSNPDPRWRLWFCVGFTSLFFR